MDDSLQKIIAAVVLIAAVIYDWPRAIAGVAVGYFGRRMPYPRVSVALGVVAAAAIGEILYPFIGRTVAPTWGSFALGLLVAGVTAYGIFRTLYKLQDNL